MGSARRDSRRFTTLDAMALIASTAAGLASLWLLQEEGDWERFLFRIDEFSFRVVYYFALPALAAAASPFLSAWTLAWIVVRLRGPRPRWRRLVRQPGATVAFVVILAWAVGGLVTLRWGADVHHGTPDVLDFWIVQLASATMLGGFGVVVAWAGSALLGQWRPEASWVDRLGRVLGVGWITLGVPSCVLLREFIGPFY